MNKQRLWAPWRLEYVRGDTSADADADSLPEPAAWQDGADRECFLCRAAATYDPSTAADRRLLVAARQEHTLVVLNRYPYNNGHLLVSPLRHVAGLAELTPEEHLECMQALSHFTTLLADQLNAEGFNIGLNLGKVAGAGVAGHLHWHLVPRWPGDNNFMPVLADTRVLPQSLDELWQMLSAAAK